MHTQNVSAQLGCDGMYSLLHRVVRLTDLLSRLRLNYSELLDENNRAAVQQATESCRSCSHTVACDRWRKDHQEGEDNATPWFCPALQALGLLAPVSILAHDHGARRDGSMLATALSSQPSQPVGSIGSGKRRGG